MAKLTRVLPGDISTAARAVMMHPKSERWAFACRLIDHARSANHFLTQTGRAHPLWGSGSLMSAARRCPCAAEPGFDDWDYAEATILVLQALHLGANKKKGR